MTIIFLYPKSHLNCHSQISQNTLALSFFFFYTWIIFHQLGNWTDLLSSFALADEFGLSPTETDFPGLWQANRKHLPFMGYVWYTDWRRSITIPNLKIKHLTHFSVWCTLDCFGCLFVLLEIRPRTSRGILVCTCWYRLLNWVGREGDAWLMFLRGSTKRSLKGKESEWK